MRLLKYADSTILLECLHGSDSSELQLKHDMLVQWCDETHVTINTSKTKEMLFTHKQHYLDLHPLHMHQTAVEKVSEYKYLGTIRTPKLDFTENSKLTLDSRENLYVVTFVLSRSLR